MLDRHASSRIPDIRLTVVSLLAALLLQACATPQRSTRMTVDDIARMSEQMAQSLANSKALRDRTPESPRWLITLQKVENLSSDLLTEGERWAVMAKIQSSLPIQALWKQRNIRLIIPAEKTRVIQQQPDMQGFENTFGHLRNPTHVMTATFRSTTRADATHRTELYYCQFEMMDLKTSVPVWQDRFEYKRVAAGHIWD